MSVFNRASRSFSGRSKRPLLRKKDTLFKRKKIIFLFRIWLKFKLPSTPGGKCKRRTFFLTLKLHLMVQTDISQLTAECSEWRQILRNYREEFHNCEKALTEACKRTLTKDHLTQVEHFQNQFDIQLRNIHDLKQLIKAHERKLAHDSNGDEVFAAHESLLSEFLALENTLQELRDEFRNFVNNTSC